MACTIVGLYEVNKSDVPSFKNLFYKSKESET